MNNTPLRETLLVFVITAVLLVVLGGYYTTFVRDSFYSNQRRRALVRSDSPSFVIAGGDPRISLQNIIEQDLPDDMINVSYPTSPEEAYFFIRHTVTTTSPDYLVITPFFDYAHRHRYHMIRLWSFTPITAFWDYGFSTYSLVQWTARSIRYEASIGWRFFLDQVAGYSQYGRYDLDNIDRTLTKRIAPVPYQVDFLRPNAHIASARYKKMVRNVARLAQKHDVKLITLIPPAPRSYKKLTRYHRLSTLFTGILKKAGVHCRTLNMSNFYNSHPALYQQVTPVPEQKFTQYFVNELRQTKTDSCQYYK